MRKQTMKSLVKKIETMTAQQFISQSMEFFEQLYQEVYEGIDLTIKDPKLKIKGRKKGRIRKRGNIRTSA